jgi:hypothetical protein
MGLSFNDEHTLVKNLDQQIWLVQQEIVSVQVHSIL